jgi:hypothetical protein
MIVGAGAATLCTAILVRDLKHRPQSDAQALEFRAPALEQAASVQQWQRDHRSPPFFFSWDLEMMGGFVHDVAPPFHVTTDAGGVCARRPVIGSPLRFALSCGMMHPLSRVGPGAATVVRTPDSYNGLAVLRDVSG